MVSDVGTLSKKLLISFVLLVALVDSKSFNDLPFELKIELRCGLETLNHCYTLAAQLRSDYFNTLTIQVSTKDEAGKSIVENKKSVRVVLVENSGELQDPAEEPTVLISDVYKTNLDLIHSLVRSKIVDKVAQNNSSRSLSTIQPLETIKDLIRFLVKYNRKPLAFAKTSSKSIPKLIIEGLHAIMDKNYVLATIDPTKNDAKTLLKLLDFPDNQDDQLLMMNNGAYFGHHHIVDNAKIDEQIKNIKSLLVPSYSGQLIFFYTEWCGHSQRAKPEWFAAKKLVEKDYPDVKMIEYDCDKHAEICQKNQIRGYPTIKVVDSNNITTDYLHERVAKSFVKAAQDLSKKGILNFKSLKDSKLKKSEFPFKAHQLLSIDDLFQSQEQNNMIILIFPSDIQPSVILKSLEIYSDAIGNSGCPSFDFLFYLAVDPVLNDFLKISEIPSTKLVKFTKDTTYIVENIMDDDITPYITSCNLLKNSHVHTSHPFPLFKNQQPYLPLSTIIDVYAADIVKELEKSLSLSVNLFYEETNIFIDINGTIFDVLYHYNITDIKGTVNDIIKDLNEQILPDI